MSGCVARLAKKKKKITDGMKILFNQYLLYIWFNVHTNKKLLIFLFSCKIKQLSIQYIAVLQQDDPHFTFLYT